MLLAIADHANEDGIAWPGITHLAHKTRLSDRQAKRVIRHLTNAKEIIIRPRFRNTHLYQFPGWKDGHYYISQGVTGDTLNLSQGVTGDTLRGSSKAGRVTPRVIEGDIAMSPESSVTVINASVSETDWPTLWTQVLESLQLQISDATYDTWLARTYAVPERCNGRLVVATHNSQAREWLSSRLQNMTNRTIAKITGRSIPVEFVMEATP